MPPSPPLPLVRALPPALAEMLQSGVSCIVSSCSVTLQPSLMRAMGTLVRPDGEEITVFLARSQSQQLLQDIADTGRLAVVFSQPSSHRTVQFKARAPRLREADASDRPVLQRYLRAMEDELRRVGFTNALAQALLASSLDDLVALSFEPELAFDQTPGPKAGAAVPQAAGSGAARP